MGKSLRSEPDTSVLTHGQAGTKMQWSHWNLGQEFIMFFYFAFKVKNKLSIAQSKLLFFEKKFLFSSCVQILVMVVFFGGGGGNFFLFFGGWYR